MTRYRQPVLSPVDLIARNDGPVRLGGRVRRRPNGRWDMTDAFCGVAVGDGAEPPPDGSLVVVQARWADRMLKDVVVVERRDVVATRGLSEACRFRRIGTYLRERARIVKHIRAWFDEHGFLEVETPQRVPSPGLDLHLDAFAAGCDYLITSPEYQMKRLLTGGIPRIYQLVHCFRAHERGALHNSEFLMLEWYRAFAGIDEVIDDTQRIITLAAASSTGGPFVVRDGRRIELDTPFERLSVVEAFERFSGLDADTTLNLAESDEETYFRRWVEDVEPGLAALPHAVVLLDFPAVHASLARRNPKDDRFCERFEIYVGGVELCNGFGELTDPVEQRQRFEKDQALRRREGKPVYPIDAKFLRALEEGMPPSGGNALGVDRLVSLCLGVTEISEVIAFPDNWL